TMPQWRRTMAALVPVNQMALEAYDELEGDAGLEDRTIHGSIVAAFREPEPARALLTEFDHIRQAGLDLDYEPIDGEEVRRLAPVVAEGVATGVRIDNQRFVDPGRFVGALGDAVRSRGAELREGAEVRGLRHGP